MEWFYLACFLIAGVITGFGLMPGLYTGDLVRVGVSALLLAIIGIFVLVAKMIEIKWVRR